MKRVNSLMTINLYQRKMNLHLRKVKVIAIEKVEEPMITITDAPSIKIVSINKNPVLQEVKMVVNHSRDNQEAHLQEVSLLKISI